MGAGGGGVGGGVVEVLEHGIMAALALTPMTGADASYRLASESVATCFKSDDELALSCRDNQDFAPCSFTDGPSKHLEVSEGLGRKLANLRKDTTRWHAVRDGHLLQDPCQHFFASSPCDANKGPIVTLPNTTTSTAFA